MKYDIAVFKDVLISFVWRQPYRFDVGVCVREVEK